MEDTITDKRVGYRIVEMCGQYYLKEKRLQVTKTPWWNPRNNRRYYSLLVKPYIDYNTCREAMNVLIAQDNVVVNETNFNLKGDMVGDIW